MAKKFTIEIGFDWDIIPDPKQSKPGQPVYLMEHTLMHMDPKTFGQAASYSRLHVGQETMFPVFENTEDTSVQSFITGFQFEAVDAHTGQPATPFGSDSPQALSGQRIPLEPGSSQIYGSAPGVGLYENHYFTIQQPGRYLVTMTLEVQKGGETRTFSIDPEWIVGG